MVKGGSPATDFGLRGWASVTTIFYHSLLLVTFKSDIRGTTRHRRAFKIATGHPSSPGHAGSLVDWAVTRPRDGSPFSRPHKRSNPTTSPPSCFTLDAVLIRSAKGGFQKLEPCPRPNALPRNEHCTVPLMLRCRTNYSRCAKNNFEEVVHGHGVVDHPTKPCARGQTNIFMER